MNPEKKAKLKELRDKLANLSPEIRAQLQARGLIATVEGRTLSLYNTMMCYLQNGHSFPTVVGGYQQWRRAGKQVKKGEHGMTILFPIGEKDEETGDVLDAERFFTATVFDISQVQDVEPAEELVKA